MWLRTSVRLGLAQLVQAGHEHGFIAKGGCSVVVRMASLPVGQDHHSRTLLANHLRHPQAVFPGVLYAAVGNIQSLPETYLENLCRFCRFLRAIVGCAARSHLALREIENPSALASLCHFEQRTAASLLYVVPMRGDGQ